MTRSRKNQNAVERFASRLTSTAFPDTDSPQERSRLHVQA